MTVYCNTILTFRALYCLTGSRSRMKGCRGEGDPFRMRRERGLLCLFYCRVFCTLLWHHLYSGQNAGRDRERERGRASSSRQIILPFFPHAASHFPLSNLCLIAFGMNLPLLRLNLRSLVLLERICRLLLSFPQLYVQFHALWCE